MNLYLISQDVNNDYDTYDMAVVTAESEEEAKKIHPSGRSKETGETVSKYSSWVALKDVHVVKIGIANEGFIKGVICASYHAG